MTLYDDLGVGKDATPEEIAKAFKDKAKKTHPDVGGSEEEFKKISYAKLVLCDPETRSRYDKGEDLSKGDIPDELQKAMGIIAVLMDGIVSNILEEQDKGNFHASVETFNVRDGMIKILSAYIGEASKKITNMERHKYSLERVAKKLTMKKIAKAKEGAKDYMPLLMASKIDDCNLKIKMAEDDKRAHEVAMNLIYQYDYAMDPYSQFNNLNINVVFTPDQNPSNY